MAKAYDLDTVVGAEVVGKLMAVLTRAGWKPSLVAQICGCTVRAVYCFCRRRKIRLRPVQKGPTFIYALRCPVTRKVRWVGRSNDPEGRLGGHFSKPTNRGMAKWLARLKKKGLRPFVEVVQKVKFKGWREAESRWIKKLRRRNPLLNVEP